MKLNLGGGNQKIPGFVNVDRLNGQEVFPLPAYADGSVDEIRASHILEHFGHREVPEVLTEWVRVLKPNGVMRIAVPDFDYIVQHRTDELPIESYLMGGQNDDNDYHRSVYSERKLRDLMEYIGLTDITRWVSEIQDCASLPVSLNLQGTKSTAATSAKDRIEVKAKVAALMSVPRLGWNDHWGSAWQALKTPEFNIPLYKFGGAFWEQGMQRGLSAMIEQGTEWAICLDYDTLFDASDVKELLTLAAMYPKADAIVPVQVRRNNDQFLFSMQDAHGNLRRSVDISEFDPDLTAINTGHFGMTLIKLAALADIPKPWLWSQPDENGDWSDDKCDADIYFWRKFKAAGKRIYQANHIKIGHIQVISSWATNDWQIKHQYLSDWTDKGKPKECKRDED
jgi:predicted SAM-dependent methyltransferase